MEPYYEPMSPLDASFLSAEDPNAHMHVGSVNILEAKPLTLESGELDIASIRGAIEQMLGRNPCLRRKIWWPVSGPPVWIDDADFRLTYHLRHSALPLPGSLRQLKRMVGRLMSQSLDLSKPPWEIWVIEGLEGDRLCTLAKIHHCLADGITARDLLTGYLGTEPRHHVEVADAWRPRPAPSLARVRIDRLRRQATQSRDLLRRGLRQVGQGPGAARSLLSGAVSAVSAASSLVGEVSHTPFNRQIGPHRRIDWTHCDFAEVQRIRHAAGGKVNDVVLACVTGAVRRFLLARKLRVDDLDFRVMIPVNVRSEDEARSGGNRVSNMSVSLPLFETDPVRRLQRVIEVTSRAKRSKQSVAGDWATQLADVAGLFAPRALVHRASGHMAANMVVTNVPGPSFPLYMLEARLLESYPLVPLTMHQALGVALYTYDGVLSWGLHADWDALPDLHDFAEAIDAAFLELSRAYAPPPAPNRAPERSAKSPGDGSAAAEPKPRRTRTAKRPARRSAVPEAEPGR